MSMPNIPDMNANINIDIKDTVSMLLSSIALEEMGLSHIINAEAEKVQYVVGTLHENQYNPCRQTSTNDLLRVNRSIDRTLRGVLKNQMLLQMKLEDTIDLCDKLDINYEQCNDGSGINCKPEYF